jgi:RNA polymerase sigma-70 factor (ECF subfamily)
LEVVAEHTDVHLVEMARTGDSKAFRVLVQRYERQVAGVVIGMLGRTVEADDVGQETFIRFFRALKDFRGDAALGTYLTRIAINLSLNELKKRKRNLRNVALDEDHLEIRQLGTEEMQDRRESKELVNKAIQALDPPFRSVIVLRMIEGYSSKETADILEIPLGTVLSRMKRAQEKLKLNLIKLM